MAKPDEPGGTLAVPMDPSVVVDVDYAARTLLHSDDPRRESSAWFSNGAGVKFATSDLPDAQVVLKVYRRGRRRRRGVRYSVAGRARDPSRCR